MSEALQVELPAEYYSAMTSWPFLSHEDSTELWLWDDEQAVIDATRARRADPHAARPHAPWPSHLVQIGATPDGPLALDCRDGRVHLMDGDAPARPPRHWPSVRGVIHQMVDGYRGELRHGVLRRDSRFVWVSPLEDLPWEPAYRHSGVHPFIDEPLLRVDQASARALQAALERRGFSVYCIDGRRMGDDEAFFDELARALHPDLVGGVDEWPDFSHHLTEHLRAAAAGGLHQGAILWEHADQTLRDHPARMIDGYVAMTRVGWGMFEECGARVHPFFLGAPAAGFTVRLAPDPPAGA